MIPRPFDPSGSEEISILRAAARTSLLQTEGIPISDYRRIFMSRFDYRRRQMRRRRQALSRHLPTLCVLLAVTVLAGGGIFALSRFVLNKKPGAKPWIEAGGKPVSSDENVLPPSEEAEQETIAQDDISRLLAQADYLAKGYDYDRAAELIHNSGLDLADSRITETLERYENEKAALVPADIDSVTHIFFHSLIMDTAKAFDGDSDSQNYNSVMTTKDEFLAILEQMYFSVRIGVCNPTP